MRDVFCRALLEQAHRPDFVFLTGDLGFKALEPLRDALGPRFINAGVAEQNMVGVAAGLARSGLRPWAYSIAPFLYARPFEHIRNDVCLHRLPVILVGNGGGYGYGVMGATHHALEDYGALLCLPNLRAYVPAFDADVPVLVRHLFEADHPAYLRLGLAEAPAGVAVPSYAPWRRLLEGEAGTLACVGPMAGGLWEYCLRLPASQRPALWLVGELPPVELPAEFLEDVRRSGQLLVVEEHVVHGGLGQMLARDLLAAGRAPAWFAHRAAIGYPSGRYGSQQFHRRECGLDPPTALRPLLEAVRPGGAP